MRQITQALVGANQGERDASIVLEAVAKANGYASAKAVPPEAMVDVAAKLGDARRTIFVHRLVGAGLRDATTLRCAELTKKAGLDYDEVATLRDAFLKANSEPFFAETGGPSAGEVHVVDARDPIVQTALALTRMDDPAIPRQITFDAAQGRIKIHRQVLAANGVDKVWFPVANVLLPQVLAAMEGDLRTARLRLRPAERADLAPLAAWMADGDTPKMLGITDTRQIPTGLEAWFTQSAKVWSVMAGNELVGAVSLPWRKSDRAEIAWLLRPEARGKGYAKEAAQRVIDRLFREPAMQAIEATIYPVNVASIALAKSLGFVATGAVRHGQLVFERRR